MTSPRVSVIIPAYNASRTVGTAVDSVLRQTFTECELIVVDDGSTDDTAGAVLSREDRRIRCVTTANGGVARARNHGLELARGEFVAFLDADDVWRPEKLKRQLETMDADSSIGLCFTSVAVVDDALRRITETKAESEADYCAALLTKGNIAGSCSSVMVRRALIDSAGRFDSRLSQCADWDMWLRLSLVTAFAPIREPLVMYRKAPGSMSGDVALLERDTFAMLDKFFSSLESSRYRSLRRRVYGQQWMVCSGTYLHAGRMRDSLRCLRRGLATDPRSVRRPLLMPVRLAARTKTAILR